MNKPTRTPLARRAPEAAGPSLAGQRPRTAQRHRTRADPGDRPRNPAAQPAGFPNRSPPAPGRRARDRHRASLWTSIMAGYERELILGAPGAEPFQPGAHRRAAEAQPPRPALPHAAPEHLDRRGGRRRRPPRPAGKTSTDMNTRVHRLPRTAHARRSCSGIGFLAAPARILVVVGAMAAGLTASCSGLGVFVRKPPPPRRHHHHHHHRAASGQHRGDRSRRRRRTGERRRKRRRRRRQDHRPRNPTLAETGGLPPARPGPPDRSGL